MHFTAQSTTFIYSLINKRNNFTQKKIIYLDHTDLGCVFLFVCFFSAVAIHLFQIHLLGLILPFGNTVGNDYDLGKVPLPH